MILRHSLPFVRRSLSHSKPKQTDSRFHIYHSHNLELYSYCIRWHEDDGQSILSMSRNYLMQIPFRTTRTMNTKLDPALEKESKKVQELIFYLRCCKAAFWGMSIFMIINVIVLWAMITGKMFGPLFQPSKPSLETCTSIYNTFRSPNHLSTEI
jgi:hypothetical protein